MTRWMVAAAMLAAGCDRSYGACDGTYELTEVVVDTSGEVPVFDWSYGTAYALSVYATDGARSDEMIWHVQCGGDNLENDEQLEEQVCIETPIAYGDTVDSEHIDTVNTTPAAELTPGATYLVLLSTLLEEDPPEPEDDGPAWLDFLDWQRERDDSGCGSGFAAEAEFVAP